MTTWTQPEAIALACLVESVAPSFGCHVALSGGCLYKEGERKDVDLILYRIRQAADIDILGLFEALRQYGIFMTKDHGFCVKAQQNGRSIDFLFPDRDPDCGDYPENEEVDLRSDDFDSSEAVLH